MKNLKKILIVEDDRDINDLIAYNLQKSGFAVEQVFDGHDAREKLERENFNIIILDIMLPGASGFDICREVKLKNGFFQPFIIMVSAKTSPQDKLYAHILGADCYFAKPFSAAILIETVNEVYAMQNREFVVQH